jgi:hypothetical protein
MKNYDWPWIAENLGPLPTTDEVRWRMKGFLDCLRHQKVYGPVDPKYIEYLIEKTGEKPL